MNDGSRICSTGVARRPHGSTHSRAYKIALYGFGSQPVVHRHLIELAAKEKSPLTWCAILTTPHYRAVIGEVLPPAEVLDVFRVLPRVPIGGDPACLSRYPGSLVEDLAAQKRTHRRRDGQWLLNRGIDYYQLYKKFLTERGATHLLMSTIETPEEKIAVAAASELGLGVIAPVDLRNMTGTYFSTDCYETPPAYAAADSATCAKAAEFVRLFRENPRPPRDLPVETAASSDDTILPAYLPSLWRRAVRFVKTAIERSDIFDSEILRIGLMGYVKPVRSLIRGTRALRNARQYDVSDVKNLPKRFVFYPLQYTPESSINTPAPYFVDQFRVIDALRFAVPSDHLLVVKEHPSCVEMRPTKFMRRVRKLPGVVVVKAAIPGIEVIKRAALTATVTGTAAFEAFLLGRPAVALGGGLSSWAIGRVPTLAGLRGEILNAINEPVSEDFVIGRVAKLMSVRYPFTFNTPHLPGEPMLRLHNMQRFLSALVDHLQRERETRPQTEQSVR